MLNHCAKRERKKDRVESAFDSSSVSTDRREEWEKRETDLVQARSMELVRTGFASPVGERSIADADDPVELKVRERETK